MWKERIPPSLKIEFNKRPGRLIRVIRYVTFHPIWSTESFIDQKKLIIYGSDDL